MQNLPLPYASQKYIIQANREAAQRLRREFPVEFIRTPKVGQREATYALQQLTKV